MTASGMVSQARAFACMYMCVCVCAHAPTTASGMVSQARAHVRLTFAIGRDVVLSIPRPESAICVESNPPLQAVF